MSASCSSNCVAIFSIRVSYRCTGSFFDEFGRDFSYYSRFIGATTFGLFICFAYSFALFIFSLAACYCAFNLFNFASSSTTVLKFVFFINYARYFFANSRALAAFSAAALCYSDSKSGPSPPSSFFPHFFSISLGAFDI